MSEVMAQAGAMPIAMALRIASAGALAAAALACLAAARLRGDRAMLAYAGWLGAAALAGVAALAGAALAPASGAAGLPARMPYACVALLLVAGGWLAVARLGEAMPRARTKSFTAAVTALGVAALAAALAAPSRLVGPAMLLAGGLAALAWAVLFVDALRSERSVTLTVDALAWSAWFTATLSILGSDARSLQLARVCDASAALALVFAWGLATTLRADHQRREQFQRKALESARKYRHVYYTAPVALVSIDLQGRVLRWNEMAERFFGSRLVGGRVNFIANVLGESLAQRLVAEVGRAGRHESELRIAGEAAAADRVCAIDALAAGEAIEISVVDVSERRRLADALEHMAYHDFLTDLLNRRGLERHIEGTLERVRAGARAALVYVDLDRFKAINDVFGHAAGDAVVVEVARRMQDALPKNAVAGRVGGDEFLVVVDDANLGQAHDLAGRLMHALGERSYAYDGTLFDVEASMGVIEATPRLHTSQLIAYADEACAQSKKAGRGKITALQPSNELLDNYRAEIRYGTQLKSSLPSERMLVYAQPIVALRADSSELCYEVLLRTRDDDGSITSPARLLAAAERHGGMAAIDRFMLSRSLEHLARHPEHASALSFLTVNLSGMSLNNDRFLRDAIGMLRDHRHVASKLCLEITESVALYDVGNTRRFIDQMQALGVRIALDDFGAGYTSFAYLKDLPASLLKIDGQFVVDLARRPKHQGIIRAIQQLGQQFGMACLAEWVEDVSTLRALLDLEIDYAQGFVFSKAQPLESWLTASADLTPLEQARRMARGTRARRSQVAQA